MAISIADRSPSESSRPPSIQDDSLTQATRGIPCHTSHDWQHHLAARNNRQVPASESAPRDGLRPKYGVLLAAQLRNRAIRTYATQSRATQHRIPAHESCAARFPAAQLRDRTIRCGAARFPAAQLRDRTIRCGTARFPAAQLRDRTIRCGTARFPATQPPPSAQQDCAARTRAIPRLPVPCASGHVPHHLTVPSESVQGSGPRGIRAPPPAGAVRVEA